ncbi:MAG: AraC family transcriptional regulator [Pseudomonadota bacterium]
MRKTNHRIPKTYRPGIRAVELSSDHTFSKHSHDEFGIGLIHQGGHRSTSGHGVVEAICGDIITVSPGEIHDGAPLGDRPRRWTMLYFEPECVASNILDEELGKVDTLEFAQPVVSSKLIASRFARFYRLATQETELEDELEAEENLLGLLMSLLKNTARATTDKNKGALRAIKLMRDDPSASITLTNLAEVSGMSRYQTIRAVTRQTGFTPFAYLRQQRLDRARRLVMDGTPISEAALLAGFSDQSHLTRAFKSAYGITPGALRAATL